MPLQTAERLQCSASPLARLRQLHRRVGLLGVLERATLGVRPIGRFGFVGAYAIFSMPRGAVGRIPQLPPGYAIGEGSLAALDEMLDCLPAAEQAASCELFVRLFAEGARCALVRHQRGVVGIGWSVLGRYEASFGSNPRTRFALQLPEGAAFISNGYIAEAHRGKRLYPQLLRYRMWQHAAAGEIYSLVSASNQRSLAAHRALGFSHIGHLICAQAFGNALFFQHSVGLQYRFLRGPVPCLKLGS